MRSYLVLSPDENADPEKLRFICDGFSWLALIFGPFWLLANRVWMAGLLTLLASVILAVAGGFEHLAFATGAASLALNLFIALEALGWKAHAMEKRGWQLRDVIVASGIDEAEELYFSSTERDTGPSFTVPGLAET